MGIFNVSQDYRGQPCIFDHGLPDKYGQMPVNIQNVAHLLVELCAAASQNPTRYMRPCDIEALQSILAK